MKKIWKIGYWIIILALLLVAGSVAISVLDFPGSYKLLAVQSGSMEPVIKMGSVVMVQPADNYQKGDVITFTDPRRPKDSVTHRIFEVKTDLGKEVFITKGDANNSPDMETVSRERVLGKALFSIPLVGFVISFAKTQMGFILMIIVPATVIVYSELMNIKNEAKKLIEERKRRKLTMKEKVEEKIGEEILKAEEEIKGVLKNE